MEKIDYKEIMHLAEDSFYEYKNDEGYSVEQSLAAALEDCILMMKKNRIVHDAVIIALSKISIEYFVLPDYLYDRALTIMDNHYKDLYPDFAEECYSIINDIKTKVEEKNIEIIKDELYKGRVSMLLKDNI